MIPRLSVHFSIFGLVFFVSKSLLGISRQCGCVKFAILILNLRCILLNARSLRNKVLELQALLLEDYFPVIAITETWLDSSFMDFD